MEKEITILYHQITGQSWLGGSHYFDNLTRNASNYYPELHFVGTNLYNVPELYTNPFTKLKVLLNRKANRSLSSELIRQGKINFLKSLIKSEQACIYSVAVEHIRGMNVFPCIFWIPDFQVFHLPQFFEEKDIVYRKKSYREGGAAADLIVLSSRSSQNDLEKFYPDLLPKTRVLNFVVDVPKEIFAIDPEYLIAKYSLPDKFFYVPNQFWKHKNHLLVLQALNLAREQMPDIHVVFSGSAEDLRNPEYFPSLLEYIEKEKLDSCISMLGIISKEDVFQLMRQSCALINASRFEGWSTTVEEVKSIGKKILLSDIDVHREQNAPEAMFFRCDDSVALSKHMMNVWRESSAGPDVRLEKNATELLEERKKKFASAFKKIIEEAIEIHNRK